MSGSGLVCHARGDRERNGAMPAFDLEADARGDAREATTGLGRSELGIVLATVWLAGAAALDVLTIPHVTLAALFAVAPLIACALLPPAGTALFAAVAVMLTAGSGQWHGIWGTSQQTVRILDVTVVGVFAVLVSTVRAGREGRYARAIADVEAARRAAHEAGAQFTAAFERAPVGMLLVDAQGSVIEVNQAFRALSGYSGPDLLGSTWELLKDPFEDDDRAVDFGRLVHGGDAGSGRERRLRLADGSTRWVSVSIAALERADGPFAVVHVQDVDDRKTYEGRLQVLADHDPLTGVFNRRRFHEELEHQLALDARSGGSSAVVLLDLDNFKYINDTLGHQVGDHLIQTVAHALRSRLRETDVLGRLGGDEFCALLPGVDEAAAQVATAALISAVGGAEIQHDEQRVRSTGSAGIYVSRGDLADAHTVLASADMAMYAAKDAGRDTFVVYDPSAGYVERARARFLWIDQIRHALDHDEFTLHAQPILDLATDTVTGYELLLRMRVDGRLVHPDSFLPVAERHGLANAIDRKVVAQGIRLAAGHPDAAALRWEINLSADSLSDPRIPELIELALGSTGLPPASLVFEITESAAITNLEEVQQFATRLTDLGCRFALDDFGAGYGSFYYLKHLPFEYLKIDGEFVRHLTTSETDRVIVEAIVGTAQRLGKQTIAEYVTDQATLDLVRRLHVDHAQGYFIGEPGALDMTARRAPDRQ
ncbi:MAG: EAL domain-containing protein [Mycobacteriales bacterium]